MLSAAEIVEEPAGDPVSLDQLKVFLRVDGDALDVELGLLLVAAQEELELLTGLRLVDQVVRVRADAAADLNHLTVGPVQEIIAIGTLSPAGSAISVAVDDFELTGAGLARGIAAITTWPAAFHSRPIFVDLRVGYGAEASKIPASLRLALLAMVRGRYDDRPADVERLIQNYRINA